MPKIKGRGHMSFDRKKQVAHVRWSTGKQPDGSYGQISKTFHNVRTLADAWEAADAYRREVNMGVNPAGWKITIQEYSEKWLERRIAAGQHANGTIANERAMLKHVVAAVGTTPLEDVNLGTVDELAAKLAAAGRSQSTVNDVQRFLHRLVKDAARDGTIGADRLQMMLARKVDRGTRRALTPEEAGVFREEMSRRHDGLAAAALISLATGTRLGETLALTWADVTLDHLVVFGGKAHKTALISITKARTCHDTDVVKPKTKSSIRTVWTDETTNNWLKSWMEAQRRAFEDVGATWDTTCEVCTTARLRPYTHSVFEHAWRRWRELHGFHGLRFHELRHTMASLKLALGADLTTVQASGGWATPDVLLGYYAHALDDSLAASAISYGAAIDAKSLQKIQPVAETVAM